MITRPDGFVALNRFGLGAGAGDLSRVDGDPRGWVLEQLDRAGGMPPEVATFGSGEEQARGLQTAVADKSILRDEYRQKLKALYLDEMGQRTLAAIHTDAPLVERLVHFWSNHFTVSVAGKPILSGLVGAYEREAIRPHVTGRFADMLHAVVTHPAMLIYLDNATSFGPDSRVGRRRDKGLNENLARELLELHTLGVGGGYTQADVQELAKILTGWSLGRVRTPEAGQFQFHQAAHEPGDKTLLGKRYSEGGMSEGEAALLDLARHPSTARHIATQLARHFVADQPPAAVVDRLARVFQDSDGDLGHLMRVLISMPEAWAHPLAKVKSPTEFVVAALRLTTFKGETDKLVGSLSLLGQAPLAAPSPAGWPDTAADWVGPEAMLRRIDWSMALAQRLPRDLSPTVLADAAIGPVAGRDTMLAIQRAADVREGFALLFASREFQRR